MNLTRVIRKSYFIALHAAFQIDQRYDLIILYSKGQKLVLPFWKSHAHRVCFVLIQGMLFCSCLIHFFSSLTLFLLLDIPWHTC